MRRPNVSLHLFTFMTAVYFMYVECFWFILYDIFIVRWTETILVPRLYCALTLPKIMYFYLMVWNVDHILAWVHILHLLFSILRVSHWSALKVTKSFFYQRLIFFYVQKVLHYFSPQLLSLFHFVLINPLLVTKSSFLLSIHIFVMFERLMKRAKPSPGVK